MQQSNPHKHIEGQCLLERCQHRTTVRIDCLIPTVVSCHNAYSVVQPFDWGQLEDQAKEEGLRVRCEFVCV